MLINKFSFSRNNLVHSSDLVLPIFVTGSYTEEIKSMPGVYRNSIEDCIRIVGEAISFGIQAIIIFPVVDKNLKSENAKEAYNEDNLVCTATREIKNVYGTQIGIISDIALDPYTTHGHDGLLSTEGNILNDETIKVLCKQALVQTISGVDIVAPSDMMDGRVLEIRKFLDMNSCENTCIASYTAKFASNLYTPFRDAIGSKVKSNINKSTYQMDFHNYRESKLEAELDISESTDMLIVKPGLMYLDIIQQIRNLSSIPILAYNISGEYSMIKSIHNRSLDLIYKSLITIKRSGADAIITYSALEIAKDITNNK